MWTCITLINGYADGDISRALVKGWVSEQAPNPIKAAQDYLNYEWRAHGIRAMVGWTGFALFIMFAALLVLATQNGSGVNMVPVALVPVGFVLLTLGGHVLARPSKWVLERLSVAQRFKDEQDRLIRDLGYADPKVFAASREETWKPDATT